MSVMVRDLPKEVRPREKLLQCGASALSDIELLAILLRTGTTSKSVLHLAEDVLAQYKDKGLAAVIHMSPQEIASIHGVGLAKAATVVAAVELGRRLSERAAQTIEKVEGPEDVARYEELRPGFVKAEELIREIAIALEVVASKLAETDSMIAGQFRI